MAMPAHHHPPKRGFRGNAGYAVAAVEAVRVTVIVLLPPSSPTEQVTPARVAATLQVKVALFVTKLSMGVRVRVVVLVPPGAIDNELGEALRLKSGVPVLKTKAFDQAAVPDAPVA
jgi:dUTPase